MNGMPKPYEWTEYKNAAGEPVARAMRVMDATLWQLWCWNADKTAGYWSVDVAVVRDMPQSFVAAEAHIETHKKIEGLIEKLYERVSQLGSEMSMLGDLVDHMNERSTIEPGDVKIGWRDRLRAAFAAWQEGQH